MQSIPYPQVDEDQQLRMDEERQARLVRMLDPGEVIAEVESLVAEIADPREHPLFDVSCYYLDAGGTQTGTRSSRQALIGERYAALIRQAIDQIIARYLGDDARWEGE